MAEVVGAADRQRQLETFLAELRTVPWFAHVGEPVDDVNIVQVASWNDAFECLLAPSWVDGPFHETVDQGDPIWERGYDEAMRAIVAAGRDHEYRSGVRASAQAAYDAGAVASEIARAASPHFFSDMFEWYRRGHWPCGWDGAYPAGRLVVY